MPDNMIVAAVCLAVGCLGTGCASSAPTYPGPGSSPSATHSTLAATATRDGEMGALSARGVVEALDQTGFAVAHPVDTTAQYCPAAGCDQSIVTDVLRVESFRSTAVAETYAAASGLHQIETVVVAFAPRVPQAEQDRYWAQIQALVR